MGSEKKLDFCCRVCPKEEALSSRLTSRSFVKNGEHCTEIFGDEMG